MKGKIVFFLSILLLISGISFIVFFFLNKSPLSKDQQKIRQIFGNPDQFVISYIERGEFPAELIRNEVWLYSSSGKRIGFLAGYFFGNLEFVKENFHYVIFAIIFLSIIPMIYEYVQNKKSKKNKNKTVNPDKLAEAVND